MFDIDLFDGAASGKITQLHNLGKRVVCYFSAGTYEPWRPDASQFTAGSLISNSNLPQFDSEVWLNIGSSTALQNVIKPIMEARLDLAQAQGCDGVEPDNVDGYTNDETQGLITAQDQLAYSRWLAASAHARGMSVGLKNDVGHLSELVADFDFAVNEQCFAYGNECTAYESTFTAAGKAVFVQEYGQSGDEGQTSGNEFLNVACPYFQSQFMSALWKQTLNLDGQGVKVCELDTTNLIPTLILKEGQWEQVTLPADPRGNGQVQDIFNELPVNRYDNGWVMFGIDRNNTDKVAYIKLTPTTPLIPGEAYWVIQTIATQVTISMPAASQPLPLRTSSACASPDGCFDVPLLARTPGLLWNMLGAPYNRPATLSRSRVVTRTGSCATGCTLAQANSATVMHDTFYQFDSDADDYRILNGTDQLLPWEGAWVPVLERANGLLPMWLVAP